MSRSLRVIGAITLIAAVFPLSGDDAAPVRPGYLGFGFTIHRVAADRTSWLNVRDVDPGSPAAKAGLRAGDLIVGISGKPLQFRDGLDLVLGLAELKVGKPNSLTIVHARRRKTIEIIPTPMPDAQYEQWKANLAMLKAQRARRRN